MASRVIDITKLDIVLSKIGAYFGVPDLGGGDINFSTEGPLTETDDPSAKEVKQLMFGDKPVTIKEIITKLEGFGDAEKLKDHIRITVAKDVDKPKEIIRMIGGDNPGDFGVYGKTAPVGKPFDIRQMLEADDGSDEITAKQGRRTIKDHIAKTGKGESGRGENAKIAIFEKLSAAVESTTSLAPAVDFMLNAIPALERSACVPYFNLRIIDPSSPKDDKKLNGLSLPRALLGAASVEDGDFASVLATARDLEVLAEIAADQLPNADATVSGMELFLTPQTLASRGSTSGTGYATTGLTGGGRRFETVLNPFVPLATITDFKIDVASNVGFIAYEKGTLTLIVHDRSRLGELSTLISPAARGGKQVLLMIDWGWNTSPSVGSNNLFSQFMANAKRRSVFVVTGQTVAIGQDGQVTVTLSLVSSAANTASQIAVALGDESLETAWDNIDELLKQVRKLLQAFLNSSAGAARLQTPVYLTSLNDTTDYLKNAKEIRKELVAFAKAMKQSSKPNADALGNKLNELLKLTFKASATRGVKGKPAATVNGVKVEAKKAKAAVGGGDFVAQFKKAMAAKLAAVSPTAKVRRLDPFLPHITSGDAKKDKLFFGMDGITPKTTRSFVSLGKIMALFLAEPLAAKGEFDEIQIVFERFNERASFMHDRTIAEFPIDKDEFIKRMTDHLIPAYGPQVPVSAFAEFVIKYFLNDQVSRAYGLRTMWKIDKAGAASVRKEFDDKVLFESRLDDVMRAAYAEDQTTSYTFVIPRVQLMIKELLAGPNKDISVCRLTFKDLQRNQASAYADIIKLATQDSLGLMQKSLTPTDNQKIDAAEYTKGLQKAIDQGILVPSSDDAQQKLAGGDVKPEDLTKIEFTMGSSFKTIKRFLHENIPSVVIGAAGTGVNNASFSGVGNKLLEAAALLKSKSSNTVETGKATAASNDPWPIEVMPGRVNLTTLGCPFFEIGQDLFIDFMTGTDIDNIYRVMKISHAITTSGYETSVELINNAGLAKIKSIQNQLVQALNIIEKGADKTK